jgi:hypothetical protein
VELAVALTLAVVLVLRLALAAISPAWVALTYALPPFSEAISSSSSFFSFSSYSLSF